jgi:3-phosphoshikimate 1-carboxyvinyltransferase
LTAACPNEMARAMSVEAAVEIKPLTNPVQASVKVPGSKSYTNRALAVAALADGASHLSGALFSDDTKYMAAALNAVGVPVTQDSSACTFDVRGKGGQIADIETDVFIGNAGTAARFLTAMLCLGSGRYRIDGVPRMRERPMADLVGALRAIGAQVEEHGAAGCFPLTVSGRGRRPGKVSVTLPGNASSQFISGLVLSGPYFGGDVEVRVDGELVSKPYLDMTQAVMRDFGVELVNHDYERFTLAAGQKYRATNYAIEPDASAASYFFAAAAITGGTVTVEGLGTQSHQGDLDIVHILGKMGASVKQEANRTTVTGTGTLRGVEVDMKNLSDVAQTLAVVAPFADGPVRITGIGFIRKKETDRVGAVVRELQKLGIDAFEEADGYTVKPGVPKPGRVDTYEDHRMAMSFALLGLRYPGITILDPACTSKTFPNYFDVLETLRR